MKPLITVDIETAPHDCVGEFVTAPDLSAITAAKNLKDPAKIAEDIDKRRQAATADYEASLSRAALDWNLSRIVALAWDIGGEDRVWIVQNEDAEGDALESFWADVRLSSGIVGFRARTFDVPTLIQRSRLLRVDTPRVSLARFGSGDVIDLYDILTFDDARYEAIMPRSLKSFCKRFGIPVNDEINGSEIPDLVKAGDWDGVRAHVTSDLALTVALARRLQEAVGF